MLIQGRYIGFGSFSEISTKGGKGGESGTPARYGSGGGGGGGAGGRIKIFNEEPINGIESLFMNLEGGKGGLASQTPTGSFYTGAVGKNGDSGNYSIKNRNFELPLDYLPEGEYISKSMDTGNPSPHFDNISFSFEAPEKTSVEVYTQTAPANQQNPDIPGSWTEWSGPYPYPGEKITSPGNQWIRVRIVLKNQESALHLTPVFDSVKIEYHTDESPVDLQLGITPNTVNAADGMSTIISAMFRDTDIHNTEIFAGKLKLQEKSMNVEMELLDGKFIESDNCEIMEVEPGQYIINYTFTPEKYIHDGTWNTYFEVSDGITDKIAMDFNDTEETLTIFTNFKTILPPEALNVNPLILPIKESYNTTISFEIQDEDPYPIEEFMFTIRLKKLNSSGQYDLIVDKKLHETEGLKLVETRGHSYKFEYSFDPQDNTEEGLYDIYIEVKDNMGSSYNIETEKTDVRLTLLMNSPPDSPTWILPGRTAEQTPRIVWSESNDPDDDSLVYFIQIGTLPFGKDVLVGTGTGKNNFYDLTLPLPYGDYYVQVWSKDQHFTSSVFQAKLSIDPGANTPPRPPTSVYPDTTKDIFPTISWSGAFDIDGDELSYFIQIGETLGGSEILAKQSTGTLEQITIKEPLERGKEYFIQIWTYDGKAESHPVEEKLTVLTMGNHKPEAPSGITPDVTGDPTPTIFWSKGFDIDGDELTYFIQMGSDPGSGDIFHWLPTGTETSYLVPYNLSYGTYYVQVKCSDSKLESMILEEILNIWITGNIPPTAPQSIGPNVTVKHYPDIMWEGAHDENDEDLGKLIYFIQIGAKPDGNEILSWQMTSTPYYNVTTFLPDGVYYIQVKTGDGMANSSVYQQELYIGTFKPAILFTPMELTVVRGGSYEVKVNISNRGTIPDRINIILPGLTGISVESKNDRYDLGNIPLGPNEYLEIILLIKFTDSFEFADQVINVTAVSRSGTATTSLLVLKENEISTSGWLESFSDKSWFWPLVAIVLLGGVLLIILVIVRRKNRGREYNTGHFTEMVEIKKEKSMIKKKKTGSVTRISETPIMDPRAKRIAMAIYSAEQAQLSTPKSSNLPQLPESTRGPKIFVPDVAVGTSTSKGAQAIKALPMASIVKDIDKRAPISKGMNEVNKNVIIQRKVPAQPIQAQKTAPGATSQEMSIEKMQEITGKILDIQNKLIKYRQEGKDTGLPEKKLQLANQYFGQKNVVSLEICLEEIYTILKVFEQPEKKMEIIPPPDFEIMDNEAHTPSEPMAPAPPPDVEPPAPSDDTDVFKNLQNLIDGMK